MRQSIGLLANKASAASIASRRLPSVVPERDCLLLCLVRFPGSSLAGRCENVQLWRVSIDKATCFILGRALVDGEDRIGLACKVDTPKTMGLFGKVDL